MKKIILFFLILYKKFVSPTATAVFGPSCRFTPTCSEYTIEAVKKFGALKGLLLGIARISKCHPLGKKGFDPVPI